MTVLQKLKNDLSILVKDRTSSQWLAAVGLVFLVMIVFSLLLDQEAHAELFAIRLYYALVISVLLGLSEEMRTKIRGYIYIYIQKWRDSGVRRAHASLAISGRLADAGKEQSGAMLSQAGTQAQEIYTVYSDEFFLRAEKALIYLQGSADLDTMRQQLDKIFPDPQNDSHISVYTLCILLMLMASFFASDVFHVQLLQYLTPDSLAGVFSRLDPFVMRLIGTSIYIVICTVLLFFLSHDTDSTTTS